MPKIYGCGKGRIHREQQPIHDPENPRKREKKAKPGPYIRVVVVDTHTGETSVHESMSAAAKAIGSNSSAVNDRINGRRTGLIKERYAVARADGSAK